MTIKLSRKQKLALRLLGDPQIVDLLFGGGAGGAKSMIVCIWMLIQLRSYPGIRIGLGRKELTKLKQTTIHTLLNEAHPMLGITSAEFKYREQKGVIEYINGSEIHLAELARLPSDPEYDRFGSLNLTHAVIEEAGEVPKKGRDVFISRKNRYKNNEYNIVGKSITTCNPSINYLKQEYYKPYKDLGSGDYQKWPHGKVVVDGKRLEAYRVFVQSLAKDNPFLPPNYIEVLRQLPPAERKRLLEGNWEFKETDKMIFPSTKIDRSLVKSIDGGKRCIGVDISDTGGDKTILSLVEGSILTEQHEIEIDKQSDVAIGDQISLEIIKFCQQNNVPKENIGIDGVGVGASTRDFMKSKGWPVRVFIAGAGTEANFVNLRGETIWNMGEAMDKGEFKIYSELPTMEILREDLMAHEYETEERKIKVLSKKTIKETLGRSPDYAESAYIAYWVAFGDNDPRRNANRIGF